MSDLCQVCGPNKREAPVIFCAPCALSLTPMVSSRHQSVLHERDRLRDRVLELERALEAHLIKHRHWVSIVCDRCGTSLTLSSSTAMPEMEETMVDVAADLSWWVSRATGDALQPGTSRASGDHDRCPDCRAVGLELPSIRSINRSSR